MTGNEAPRALIYNAGSFDIIDSGDHYGSMALMVVHGVFFGAGWGIRITETATETAKHLRDSHALAVIGTPRGGRVETANWLDLVQEATSLGIQTAGTPPPDPDALKRLLGADNTYEYPAYDVVLPDSPGHVEQTETMRRWIGSLSREHRASQTR